MAIHGAELEARRKREEEQRRRDFVHTELMALGERLGEVEARLRDLSVRLEQALTERPVTVQSDDKIA